MGSDILCHTPDCRKEAVLRCQRCDRAFCGQHIVGVSRTPPAMHPRGPEQAHRYLGTPERATVWLCRDCAAAAT